MRVGGRKRKEKKRYKKKIYKRIRKGHVNANLWQIFWK